MEGARTTECRSQDAQGISKPILPLSFLLLIHQAIHNHNEYHTKPPNDNSNNPKTTTNMQTFAITAALATLASSVSAQYFGLIAARSGSPIHLSAINANANGLYIGRDTASYCPDTVVDDCPPGNSTTFSISGSTLNMGAEVPGGQQAYIKNCSGEISYTIPHSGAEPEDAIRDGWTLSPGSSLGSLSWTNGLLACPVANETGVYQIFAQVEDTKFSTECLGFDALASNVTAVTAWEYL